MNEYFSNQIIELEKSLNSIDNTVFEKMVKSAVNAIKSGHKIVVSGLGKNVPVCDKFVGTMLSLGLDAYFLNTNSAVHGDMGIIKENDMVIILTKSGETVESVYLTNLLDDRKIDLWLLTFNSDSTLTRKIPNSMVLELEHEGDMWNIMPNNSTTMNLIVLQGLAMTVAKELDLQIEDFKRNHPGGHIGETLRND